MKSPNPELAKSINWQARELTAKDSHSLETRP